MRKIQKITIQEIKNILNNNVKGYEEDGLNCSELTVKIVIRECSLCSEKFEFMEIESLIEYNECGDNYICIKCLEKP